MSTSTESRNHHVQRIMRWSGRLLASVFALLAVAAVAVVVAVPRFTDGQAMTVLSGSMTPAIPVGSIVVVRPVDPSTLRVGDVATYQVKPNKAVYVTHRVAGIDHVNGKTVFTFKGDANRGPDTKPVVAGQIRGKVWFHVPYLGTVRDDLKTRAGLSMALIALLGSYAAVQLIGGLRERRAARSEEAVRVVA